MNAEPPVGHVGKAPAPVDRFGRWLTTDHWCGCPSTPRELGDPPDGLRYETVDPEGDDLPDSVADVEFYVPGYQTDSGQGRILARMPRLKVVQTLTAGVDHIRPDVPDGVLLCNGRGIHNASTAELALTLTLASLRGIPGFVHDQSSGSWNQGWRTSLADRTVLILGYGDIGRDIERRLLPFEVEVLRVARTARDGVHTLDDLPEVLPRADVVILVIPATSETQGPRRPALPVADEGGRAARQRRTRARWW